MESTSYQNLKQLYQRLIPILSFRELAKRTGHSGAGLRQKMLLTQFFSAPDRDAFIGVLEEYQTILNEAIDAVREMPTRS